MKIHSLKNIILLVLLYTITILSYSQDTYRFRTFSPKGGFYYDGVKDILQDDSGFIWVMLENDLQRFDGYEYKRYLPYFQNQNVPDIWNFYRIVKDSSGNIYILTNNGLFRYNKFSDSFDKILDGNISSLEIDKKNNIWGISKGWLYRINQQKKSFENVYYDQEPISNILYFQSDGEGVYFASHHNKIYFCNYKEPDKVTLFHLFPADYSIAGIKKRGEYLWVLTKDQVIIKINTSTKYQEKQIKFQNGNDNIPIKTFYVDKNDNIWIGTQNGLYVLNPDTGQSQLYTHSKSDIFSLPNNSVWKITEDSHQNIWIGTFAGGLCYVNLEEGMRFKTYTPFESSLSHGLVSSFAEDENHLWIGTEGGGLNELNKSTGNFTVYKHEKNTNGLLYNNVKSLVLDSNKRLWISMYRGGLDCFDTKTKKFRHFLNNPQDKESLYNNDLRKIIPEKDSGLWVAYQTNEALVSFFSFEDEKFKHYPFDDNDYIFDIQKDDKGNLWVITRKHLYKMDIKKQIVENVSLKNIDILDAQSLCIDNDNNVWIGTIGRGLVKFDALTSQISFFEDILHYNVSAIYSICPDKLGCLWLGTDNGLISYNIKLNSYQRFDECDGVQGQVYYPLASFRSKTGELYFGGSNGFTIVNPEYIKPNMIKSRVVISDFYIDNVSANSKFETELLKGEIILDHNQNNFGFRFSSDNYLSPSKNRFKYRLKDYDDRWTTTDASNRTVMYSKVPEGTYYFEILAANNDGIWNDTPLVIKIKCKPAPWASWFAYLLYSIVVIGIAVFIFHYYKEKRKLKLQAYMDSLDKQKQEEIHRSQLRFFTNISHEFRTPLSLILATVDNLKPEGLKEFYYRILYNNAHRLLNLVNELMDFRTVENGKMQLQVQPIDINRLVMELSSDFKDYAQKQNVGFDIICDPELPDTLYIDRQIMEKVIMNLLNNSFKHTKSGGKVIVETHSCRSKFMTEYDYSYHVTGNKIPDNGFLIVIRDTGVGISKDSIGTVFERFYKVNSNNLNQHLGTGIGLALVKSLVLLHKGTISIYSERGKGTDIVVCFPADATIYDESEFSELEKNAEQSVTEKEMLLPSNVNTESMQDVFLRDKKRLLIVEDNNELRMLLSDFLSRHYDIMEATNGVEATEILGEIEVDLILSDIMMPLKDGITLCGEVKADRNTSHIPFLLLTAKTGLESKVEGADSGADIYFEKPIDFNLLLLSIRNLFKRQQSLREYYAKNYYVDSAELSANVQDNTFLKKLIEIIDKSLNEPNIDVSYIAAELSMSRSKLYSKVKMLTDKSIVEFILNYRLRKAARLIIEKDMSMSQVMEEIGIKSQSYFTSAFKKEFGETPSAFAAKHKKTKSR